MRAALERVPARGRLASICTGSFVRGAAGALEGAPGHHALEVVRELASLYPEVDVDPDVLCTDDRGVLTSAGVAAGIDLCLHMIP
ncbi:hypothetical protein LV779_09105 [Streptomyces thinghirensis]|nr:hypothetical protein [Streptomyces thinghirensis]